MKLNFQLSATQMPLASQRICMILQPCAVKVRGHITYSKPLTQLRSLEKKYCVRSRHSIQNLYYIQRSMLNIKKHKFLHQNMFQNDFQFGIYFYCIYILFPVLHPATDISNTNFNTFKLKFRKNHTLVEQLKLNFISKSLCFAGIRTNVPILNLTSTQNHLMIIPVRHTSNSFTVAQVKCKSISLTILHAQILESKT